MSELPEKDLKPDGPVQVVFCNKLSWFVCELERYSALSYQLKSKFEKQILPKCVLTLPFVCHYTPTFS